MAGNCRWGARVLAALLLSAALGGVQVWTDQGIAVSSADGTQDWASVTCSYPPVLVPDDSAIFPSTSGTPLLCVNYANDESLGPVRNLSIDFVQYASERAAQRDINMFPRSAFPVLACSRKQVEGGYTLLAVAKAAVYREDVDSVVRGRAPRVLAALSQFGFVPC